MDPTPSSEFTAQEMKVRASSTSWVESAARAGYAAKGGIYLIVGVLAASAAFGAGGRTTGSEGALETLVRQPVGNILLGLVAVGLAGYAVWRLVLCFADPENKGTDASGVVMRGYYFVSAVIHGALTWSAIQLVLGNGGSGGGGAESRTAQLMAQPYGKWLVAIVGLTIIGSAFFQFYRANEKKFREQVDYHEVSARARQALIRLGQWGLAARGVVFLVIGGFLVLAGIRSNPDNAKGLGEALATLESQPYGPWLLGFVGLGLICYAAHQFVKARYRDIG